MGAFSDNDVRLSVCHQHQRFPCIRQRAPLSITMQQAIATEGNYRLGHRGDTLVISVSVVVVAIFGNADRLPAILLAHSLIIIIIIMITNLNSAVTIKELCYNNKLTAHNDTELTQSV